MKRCARCKTEKSFDAFYRSASAKDGRYNYCIPCRAEYDKANRERIRPIARANQRKRAARNPQSFSAKQAAQRAKMRGFEADLDFLRTLPCPARCPVLGTPISFVAGAGRRDRANEASFDRIDPEKGYVPGNVRIISTLANVMLQNATAEQRVALAKWILATAPKVSGG